MATPLNAIMHSGTAIPTKDLTPKTVQSAKIVELALISYVDEDGQQHTQLTVVGDHNMILLNGANFGISTVRQPEGRAREWLKKAAFKLLGKKDV